MTLARTVLGPDDGDRITTEPERDVVIRVGLDALAVTANRYATGERGPDSHIHRRHADAFWVLAGELAFTVGAEGLTVAAPAGTFVLVPRETVHTFGNEGHGDARFLNIHAPSCGFHDHLRTMRDAADDHERAAELERFDQSGPPPDGGRPAHDVVVRPGASSVGADETGGFLAVEVVDLDRSSVPATTVPRFAYVITGTVVLALDGARHALTADASVVLPHGTAAELASGGAEPARVAVFTAPAG